MSKYYVEVEGRDLGFEVFQGEAMTELRPVESGSDAPAVHVDLAPVHSNIETGEGLYSLIVDGKSYQMSFSRVEGEYEVLISGHRFKMRVLTERDWKLEKIAPKQGAQTGPFTVKAPMPGLVKSVLVAQGDEIAQGSRLVILEAMKMENEITALRAGRVSEVHVQAGNVVEGGRALLTIE